MIVTGTASIEINKDHGYDVSLVNSKCFRLAGIVAPDSKPRGRPLAKGVRRSTKGCVTGVEEHDVIEIRGRDEIVGTGLSRVKISLAEESFLRGIISIDVGSILDGGVVGAITYLRVRLKHSCAKVKITVHEHARVDGSRISVIGCARIEIICVCGEVPFHSIRGGSWLGISYGRCRSRCWSLESDCSERDNGRWSHRSAMIVRHVPEDRAACTHVVVAVEVTSTVPSRTVVVAMVLVAVTVRVVGAFM